MTTLAVDSVRVLEIGDRNEFPVIASDIIYEGAAVGLVDASGHARPLTSADRFVGFAEKQADNSSGSAAAINVRVIKAGKIVLPVTGAVITDVGMSVYAQDDNAFSFVKTSGVFIGRLIRFVSSGYGVVEFDAGILVDPHDGLLAETVTGNITIDAQDTGKVFVVTTDAVVITLPAVEGVGRFRVLNSGAYGTVGLTIAPNANDMVEATDTAVTDADTWANTKATARRGDFVDITYGDANGWAIVQKRGTWALTAV
jgi:hypothetical protein